MPCRSSINFSDNNIVPSTIRFEETDSTAPYDDVVEGHDNQVKPNKNKCILNIQKIISIIIQDDDDNLYD